MRGRAYLSTIGRASVPWLLEGLLIVISVALGFRVTQRQQARLLALYRQHLPAIRGATNAAPGIGPSSPRHSRHH